MDLRQLKEHLNKFASELADKDKKFIEERLRGLISASPFNEYEYMLIFLRDRNVITFQEYEKLRKEYVDSNKHLHLYGLSPRVFGEIWGEEQLRNIDSRFKKASKTLDPEYDGQYDVWFEGVKLEVKACRAINTKDRGDLASKALRYDS